MPTITSSRLLLSKGPLLKKIIPVKFDFGPVVSEVEFKIYFFQIGPNLHFQQKLTKLQIVQSAEKPRTCIKQIKQVNISFYPRDSM